MASYQGYTEHYHQHPQVYDPPPKQTQPYDFEAVGSRTQTPVPVEKEQGRRIWGLRVLTFWIVMCVFVFILAGGIGGGIGGGLASSNSGGSVVTKTVTPTALVRPAASSSVPSTGFTRLYCKNDTLYTSPIGDQFKEYCSIDWAAGDTAVNGGTVNDLTNIRVATFHECMDQCALWNKKKKSDAAPCKAIAYDADLTWDTTVLNEYGNCWLKNLPGAHTTLPDDYPLPERMGVAVNLEYQA